MFPGLMFRDGHYYSSFPWGINRFSFRKKIEEKKENIQNLMSSEVKLTKLVGGSSLNVNNSGDKRKLNMDSS